MQKTLSYTEYIFYILWINAVTFVIRPMTWSVLNRNILSEASGFPQTASNLLIYLITLFVIACFFKSQNASITYHDFFIRLFKKAIFPILAIRFSADILYVLADKNGYLFAEMLVFPIETAVLFVTFHFINKAVGSQKAVKQKRFALIVILVLLFAIIVFYALLFLYVKGVSNYIVEKYKDYLFFSAEQAFGVKFQLINLLFNTVLWIGLFVYYGLFESYGERKKDCYRITVLGARIVCVVILTALCYTAKMFIIPQGTISGISGSGTNSTSYTSERKLEADYQTIQLLRMDSGEKKSVYKKTTVFIKYLNSNILAFKRKANMEHGGFYKVDMPSSVKFYRYDFDAVAYIDENGNANVMLMSDINSYKKKDENIIILTEYLIEQGYFEAFEYSYKYLLKFDPEFIQPYIDLCMDCNVEYFSENTNNEYINNDYMIDFFKHFN